MADDSATPEPANHIPTDEEYEERIDFTAHLLQQRIPKSAIKRELVHRYRVCVRTCETYLARAREELVKRSKKKRSEHRYDAVHFYDSIITSPEYKIRDRIKAQENLVDLLALKRDPEMEKVKKQHAALMAGEEEINGKASGTGADGEGKRGDGGEATGTQESAGGGQEQATPGDGVS